MEAGHVGGPALALEWSGLGAGSRTGGKPSLTQSMARMAESETAPPTERSMPAPPARMTSAWPRPTSARIVENWRTVVTVPRLKTEGLSTAKPTITTSQSAQSKAKVRAGP